LRTLVSPRKLEVSIVAIPAEQKMLAHEKIY